MGKFLEWLDHRTGYRKLRDALLLEHIPGGASWRYVWGSTLAFVFLLQLITGILLMTAYVPGDEDAWGSVYYIQYEMDFGWLIRGLHHFGSQTMVVLLAVHMLQVVIAGAHLAPREVNWWLGLALMGLILGLSLTGYLLPWDQKGYYATQVATNIIGKTPLLGPFLQKVLLGGLEYGHQTLTHFYALHVGILPPLVILLIILHLAAFRRHGVTAPKVPAPLPGEAFPERWSTQYLTLTLVRDSIIGAILGGLAFLLGVPLISALLIGGLFVFFGVTRFITKPKKVGWFWPDQAFRDLVVCLWIFAIMLTLVIFAGHGHKIENHPAASAEPGLYESWAKAGRDGLGANLDAPADPVTESYDARPEWYFLFLFQMLKYFEGDQEIIGTMVIPGVVAFLLFLVPLLGYGRMRRFGHIFGIVLVSGILLGAAALTYAAVVADSPEPTDPLHLSELGLFERKPEAIAKAKAYRKRAKEAEEEARIAIQAAGHGIPSEGARYLVRGNPLIAGKRQFKLHCASCHAYDFPKSADEEPLDAKALEPKASNLTGFATQEWIRGLLENPGSKKYFGDHPRLQGMVNWRADNIDAEREGMTEEGKKKQDEQFDQVAWWLAQQALDVEARKEQIAKDEAYAARLRDGREMFKSFNCNSCHKAEGVEKGGVKGPDLTGYGSQEWVHGMILSPGHRSRYGGTVTVKDKDKKGKLVDIVLPRNEMPAFRPPPDTGPARLALQEFFESQPDFPRNFVNPLTDFDRELIVRFLTRDDRVVFGGTPISGPKKK